MFLTAGAKKKFRALETEVLADLGRHWGGILATGGGCVTRPENRHLLRQNGKSHLAAAGHLQAGGSRQALAARERPFGAIPAEMRPV